MAVPADGLIPAAPGARIGPNAIIRIAEALEAGAGARRRREIFERAGLGRYLDAMPGALVDEDEVSDLHQALAAGLGAGAARGIARDAGTRTGGYLLAHRIPPWARRILRPLPARAASPVLLRAIARNAWTFCGSGALAIRAGPPAVLRVSRCPVCRRLTSTEPACDYYAGTFEHLFRVLVHPRSVVTETACQAMGDPACEFEIRW